MAKSAIIYFCIDNFGKPYKFVEVVDADKTVEAIAEAMRQSTEIIDHEVVDVVIK